MSIAALKKLWKNDYFQTAVLVILMLVIVYGFWYGSQWVLNTQYPALAVVSNSMQPTLNIGDIIIVQGVSAAQINAHYINGDIVVFSSPTEYDPNFRIVHRAVNKVNNSDGTWTITTHGDNNPVGAEEQFNSRYLIGKVIAKIPYVGNFSLFVNKLGNFYLFLTLLIIAVGIILSLFSGDEKKESAEKKSPEKTKLFGKITIGTVFFVIINVILISLIIFNVSGSYTFHQIGADPPQNVTVRGMYPDLQYYTTYKVSYNHVLDASLSQGFLTYGISCSVSDGVHVGVRPAVATFSLMQALLLILLLYDAWAVIKFLELRRKPRIDTVMQK